MTYMTYFSIASAKSSATSSTWKTLFFLNISLRSLRPYSSLQGPVLTSQIRVSTNRLRWSKGVSSPTVGFGSNIHCIRGFVNNILLLMYQAVPPCDFFRNLLKENKRLEKQLGALVAIKTASKVCN